MTEKEYRNLINSIELTDEEKRNVAQVSEMLSNLGNIQNKISYNGIKKYASTLTNTAVTPLKNINIMIGVDFSINLKDELKTNIIFNYLENELVEMSDLNVVSFIRDYADNVLIVKTATFDIIIKVVEQCYEYSADRLVEELNNYYTYFKNAYKIIKHYNDESKTNINPYVLLILLAYSLENYLVGRKYEDYFMAFDKGMDDFIAKKKIEILKNYNIEFNHTINEYKNFVVVDPFASINLAAKVNDVNIQDYRKLKKSLLKLFEVVQIDTKGSAIVQLDVTPILTPNNRYMWSYQIIGRGLSSSGGDYENNQYEFKTAVLKGLFRGLKTIVEQLKNKNITVICPVGKVLECISNKPEEQENNSRRKTITKFIDENKLNIKWEK